MSTQKQINQAELEKLDALFKKAELSIKGTEHQTNTLFIPAINELRYAGHHLLRYLTDGDDDNLISSQKHCKRAIYDAAEGPILKFLGDIAQFQDDYAEEACVTEVIPNYIELLTKASKARDLVGEVQPATREQYFESVKPHLDTLKEIVDTLVVARPEINKRVKTERMKKRNTNIAILLTALAAIFAITGPIPWPLQTSSHPVAETIPLKANTLPASGVIQNSRK